MNALMAAQMLPNKGIIQRVDFTMYNAMGNVINNPRATPQGMMQQQQQPFPGAPPQFPGQPGHPNGLQQPGSMSGIPPTAGTPGSTGKTKEEKNRLAFLLSISDSMEFQ